MKYFINLIFTFIFIFIVIGCDNWSENPEEKKVIPIQTQQYVTGTLKEVQLPNNTITLININGKYFSGTVSGEIFLNTSLFSSPILKGIIPNTSINCLYKFTDYSSTPNKNYLLIGTNKGLYYADENGDNLKPLFITSSETNDYIIIYSIEQVQINSTTYELSIYGWDGKNNKFSTKDFGKTWSYYNYYRGSVTSRITFQTTRRVGTSTQIVQVYLTGCNDNSYSYVMSSLNIPDFQINARINCFAYNNNDKICYCATSNGIYSSSGDNILNNKWEKIALDGYNVKSLIITIYGTLFAGTDKGAYRSNNGGTTWAAINTSFNDSLYDSYFISEGSYSNTIYLFTNGYSYTGYDPKTSANYNFSPILVYPENNSTNLPTTLQFRWNIVTNILDNNYLMQISKNKNFPENNTLNINAKTNLTYTIKDLEKNTNYFWRVKSFSIFGSTEYSSVYTFKTNE